MNTQEQQTKPDGGASASTDGLERQRFQELSDLLPADVNWFDPITPAIVREIVISIETKEREAWRPIATAPKDGRRVLVWLEEESLKRDQRQVQFARLWFYGDGTLGGGAEGFNGEWNITHWMPVPNAPNA